jgi:hypothetical protein
MNIAPQVPQAPPAKKAPKKTKMVIQEEESEEDEEEVKEEVVEEEDGDDGSSLGLSAFEAMKLTAKQRKLYDAFQASLKKKPVVQKKKSSKK